MDTDQAKLILKEETHAILGAAMAVLNELGHGFHEKPYENSLVIEFAQQGIPFIQQAAFPIRYKEHVVGEYIPDLIACGQVVVDTKVIESITDREVGQMMNYLKISRCPVGLILNFKHAKLQWKRVVL
jgi:GxxExxY protein